MYQQSIYNTVTKSKELVQTDHGFFIHLYVCGMTVYDYPHIGHARSAAVFDTLNRHLSSIGQNVIYVRNITDVDDKIIKKMHDENIDLFTLTEKVHKASNKAFKKLGCSEPDDEPKVTDHIQDIIKMIRKLIDQGFAYEEAGSVYFSVKKYQEYVQKEDPEHRYGYISGNDIEYLVTDENEDKEDPRDFVLWKKAKQDEPSWYAPWSQGRPGWHIECSALSHRYCRSGIDIHGGGVDLKFPHHECEAAQSFAHHHGRVSIWMHHGHVMLDQKKMSKSDGNFIYLNDLLDQGYPGIDIRYYLLRTHYRKPFYFSYEGLDESRSYINRICLALRKTKDIQEDYKVIDYMDIFHKALCDDLNTPEALTVIDKVVKEINKGYLGYQEMLSKMLDILGLKLPDDVEEYLQNNDRADITHDEVGKQISTWQKCLERKDYQNADNIRSHLEDKGVVILQENPTKVFWYYR